MDECQHDVTQLRRFTMSAAVMSVADALAALHAPGDVFEVRMPKTDYAGTVSGYFNDYEKAAEAIAKWDHRVAGVYFTLNPCVSSLLARGDNRLRERAKDTTGDNDIARRRWLLIDVDFHRPTGISATDGEVLAAGKLARRIKEYLENECGWPAAALLMSGNGAHILYRIDLPNDVYSRDLVKRVLTTLAEQFNEEGPQVDTSVFNASRISKVPGTWACKGDDTPERPHRQSSVIEWPDPTEPVSLSALVLVGGEAQAQKQPNGNGNGPFDIEGFIRDNGLVVKKHKQDHTGELWEFAECPFDASHANGEAFVRRDASGSISAGCQHATCGLKSWADLRSHFEPLRQQQQKTVVPAKLGEERPHEQAWSATSEEALYAFTSDLDRRKNGEIVGLPWPPEWPGLSRYVGPLEPGSLTVVAARPSIGKSLFGLQLQRWLCSKGHRVLFVSRELNKVRLIRRQVTSFGADLKRLQSGKLVESDTRAFDRYMAQSRDWKVRYDDHSQTIDEIRREAGLTKPDIIIIDYLQRLAYDTEKEYAAITRIVNELQDLTLDTNVPVVCLSQLARPLKGSEWKQPNMSDIRGSGAVEERAANIILLHRIWDTAIEEKFGKQVKVAQKQTDDGLFLIAKCADGEAGGYCRVLFNGARMNCQEKL